MFLFDEPNSALTEEESKDLFRRMHVLADAGHVVLLVSHRLAELAEHTDRVAVILDGVCTDLLEGEALTPDAIAAGLVGGQAAREPDEPVVAARRGRRHRACGCPAGPTPAASSTGIDLHVKRGEIVSIVGVEGSGARELVRSIAGFERTTGEVEVGARTGASAVATGTSLVSADRHASLFANLTIGENMVSRLGREIATGGHRAAAAADARRSRTSCATSSRSRPRRSTCRSARCRAATSRRSPSRPRS